MATFLTNLYRKPANLFIVGEVILSQEGTSQGGPEGKTRYGIAMLPLVKRLRDNVEQFCYADDSAAGVKVEQLMSWWEALKELGP